MQGPTQMPTVSAPATKAPAPTTAVTNGESTNTAFIRVYQDAGVTGVGMLTLLALCFLMATFCLRLLKLFTATINAQETVSLGRTVAVEKLASAVLLLQGTTHSLEAAVAHLTTSSAKDDTDRLRDVTEIAHRMELRNAKVLGRIELLIRTISPGAVLPDAGEDSDA